MTSRSVRADCTRDIVVNLGSAQGARAELIESAVCTALDAVGASDAEISVTLLDDAAIRAMNLHYLQRDDVTDVIAFALGDDPIVGDVYLGAGQAARQAAEFGVPVVEEFVRLAIHGTLHVLGHDHPEGPERVDSDMFVLQERLVREVLAPRDA